MSHSPDDTLVVYSDYVCPFCYLGRASMNEYLESAADPPAVDWQFFDLRGYKRGPDGEIDESVDDGKDESYFAQVRRNVDRLKEQYDVEMELDRAIDVDSWNAQKAALSVKRNHGEDAFREFHDAVFDALWREGRDIGDPDVLADIADGVGLSGDDIREAINDDELDADLEARFAEAQEAGVTAIPTFVYDDHAARGAVPPSQLRRLIEGV